MAELRSARLLLCGSAFACGALGIACADAFAPQVSAVDDLLAELDITWSSSTNPVSVSPGVTHLMSRPRAAACMYSAAGGRFVCPTRTQSGLTSSSSYQLLDAANVPQPVFVANATASVQFVTDVSGSLSAPGGAPTTLIAHADEVLSGLMSGTHTLNGTGTATFVSGSGLTSNTLSMIETTSDLVLATRNNANHYPTSGSITTQVFSGAPGPGAALLTTVTSTFNGTRIVTLVIQSGAVSQTCTIDLSNAAALNCT